MTGCSAAEEPVVAAAQPPAISRGAEGDCFKAWNALGNVRNRVQVAREHSGWSLEVTVVQISHPADSLTGTGCGYFLHSNSRWTSFSGMWEHDGDFVWATRSQGDPSTEEQEIRRPNAVVLAQGQIAPLPAPTETAAAKWRAVINDWYEDGEIEGTHTCAAVKHALAQLPQDIRNHSSAHADLAAYAQRVC